MQDETTAAEATEQTEAPAQVEEIKPAKRQRVRRETRKLTCVLSDEERAKYGERLAEAEVDLQKLKDSKKLTVKGYNVDIKELEATITDLAKATHTGEVERDVSVESYSDFARGLRITERLDTNEVLDQRALEPGETQRKFEDFAPEESEEDNTSTETNPIDEAETELFQIPAEVAAAAAVPDDFDDSDPFADEPKQAEAEVE